MNHNVLVSLLLFAVGLTAQEPQKRPRPFAPARAQKAAPPVDAPVSLVQPRHHVAPVPRPDLPSAADVTATPATPALPAPHGVAFDQVGDEHWAAGGNWKASFDPRGATFVPFLGGDAPRSYPTRFELLSVAVGERVGLARAATVGRAGNTLVLDRGDVREEYVASDAGIEQRFVLRELAQRGELVLDLAVATEFAVAANADGFAFTHPRGAFGYGRATAIDANGERTAVAAAWDDGHLRLSVPASFVEHARLPLVVDPLIGNVTTQPLIWPLTTDVAYDAAQHLFAMCYTTRWNAVDSDCRVQLFDDNMNPVGGPEIIDITSTAWDKARIAHLDAYGRFLVVAECGPAPNWIAGRTFTPTGNIVGAPFDVTYRGFQCSDPDVGGDPSHQTPTFFCVVYEFEFSPTDHDVMCVLLREDGSQYAAVQYIDVATTNEHSPRISTSDGQLAPGMQNWVVAYQRDAASPGMVETRMTTVTWDGHVGMFAGDSNIRVTNPAPSAGRGGLAVSSPTDAVHGQRYVIVDSAADVSHNGNPLLRATAVDRFGNVLASSTITNGSVGAFEPAADSDGGRFVLGWLEGDPGTFTVGTFDVVGLQVVAHELVSIGQGGLDRSCAVVALHSGGATSLYDREYGLAWCRTTNDAYVQRYRGMGVGGFGFRGTGCGPLGWNVSGLCAIGTPVQLQVTGGAGVVGCAFGSVALVPLPQCPGCSIGTTADVLLVGSTLGFTIPFDTGLVGQTYAVQGFDFGPGPCLGALWLSDTVDLTIR